MSIRAKGRDFYDLMFLSVQTKPDYDFLLNWRRVHNLQEFRQVMIGWLKIVDLKKTQKDFEHLLFDKADSEKILRFGEFINSLTE